MVCPTWCATWSAPPRLPWPRCWWRGIWYPRLVLVPALLMAFLMLCAQLAHVKVRNPFVKYVPSFLLLLLSLFVAAAHAGLIRA